MTALYKRSRPQKVTHLIDKLVERVENTELKDALGGRRGRESSKRYNARWLMQGEPMPSGWRDTPFKEAAISSAVICYLDLIEQGGSKNKAKDMLFKRVCKEYWRSGRRSEVFDSSWLNPIRTLVNDARFIKECEDIAEKKFQQGKQYRSVIDKERRALARGGMMPKTSTEIILALGDFSKLPGVARVWASGARSLEMTAKQFSSLIGRLGYGKAFKEVSSDSRALLSTIDDPDLLASLQQLAQSLTIYETPKPLGDSDRRAAIPFEARLIGKALNALGIPSVFRNGIRVYSISALAYKRARKVFRENNAIPRRKYRLREGMLPDLIEAIEYAPTHLAMVMREHLKEMIRIGRYVGLYSFVVEKPPPLAPV